MIFSYSFVWYSWKDWERLLDWAALRGVNIQLAWVGYEKIFLDSFREIGMTDDEILPFFSGPAFQSWNRFGNIQGSWGDVGNPTMNWIDSQFDLQKKIVARMVALGITPVLPAFPGFVPDSITRVRPNANITRATAWGGLENNTRDTFLNPLDNTSAELQKLFIDKQIAAFGNVTNVYTLDQFNEMAPASGDTEYLSSVSKSTYSALTKANPAAIWLLQGWLFYASEGFWTQNRIDAYLGGVPDKHSMLILDLFSENKPQWQRTKSYSGKPWIWCQLHNFGGNQALYGQVTNVTVDPIAALNQSASLMGFGLTPEGYEGNEVAYAVLLDQAWSVKAINLQQYFRDWITVRYSASARIPACLYEAWEILRAHVYDNKNKAIQATGVSIYSLSPRLSGLTDGQGHFPAPTALHYDPADLRRAWRLMIQAASEDHSLWKTPAFELDLIDVTRQVLSNMFIDIYTDLVKTYNTSMGNATTGRREKFAGKGKALLEFLELNDAILSTNDHFTMESWLQSAEKWATTPQERDLIAFNARSQVTTWNWDGEVLNDYAAKGWSGLIRSYYKQRWAIFISDLSKALEIGKLDEVALQKKIRQFEKSWQYGGFTLDRTAVNSSSVKAVVEEVQKGYF